MKARLKNSDQADRTLQIVGKRQAARRFSFPYVLNEKKSPKTLYTLPLTSTPHGTIRSIQLHGVHVVPPLFHDACQCFWSMGAMPLPSFPSPTFRRGYIYYAVATTIHYLFFSSSRPPLYRSYSRLSPCNNRTSPPTPLVCFIHQRLHLVTPS